MRSAPRIRSPWIIAISFVALAACAPKRREPTPTTSARSDAGPRPPSTPSPPLRRTLVAYPNGDGLLVDSQRCFVARVAGTDDAAWTRTVSECGGLLHAVVAPNSFAYVRSARALLALSHDGSEVWRSDLASVPAAIAVPAAMPNSAVVTAVSPRTIVAYSPTGQKAWSFDISGAETLTSSPLGSATEGLLLVTEAAVYAVTSQGELRWRTKATGRGAGNPGPSPASSR